MDACTPTSAAPASTTLVHADPPTLPCASTGLACTRAAAAGRRRHHRTARVNSPASSDNPTAPTTPRSTASPTPDGADARVLDGPADHPTTPTTARSTAPPTARRRRRQRAQRPRRPPDGAALDSPDAYPLLPCAFTRLVTSASAAPASTCTPTRRRACTGLASTSASAAPTSTTSVHADPPPHPTQPAAST